MAYIDDPQTQKANMDYIRSAMNEPLLELRLIFAMIAEIMKFETNQSVKTF